MLRGSGTIVSHNTDETGSAYITLMQLNRTLLVFARAASVAQS
jgi:hypothetical protein